MAKMRNMVKKLFRRKGGTILWANDASSQFLSELMDYAWKKNNN